MSPLGDMIEGKHLPPKGSFHSELDRYHQQYIVFQRVCFVAVEILAKLIGFDSALGIKWATLDKT